MLGVFDGGGENGDWRGVDDEALVCGVSWLCEGDTEDCWWGRWWALAEV
jgi:hypothetical protein